MRSLVLLFASFKFAVNHDTWFATAESELVRLRRISHLYYLMLDKHHNCVLLAAQNKIKYCGVVQGMWCGLRFRCWHPSFVSFRQLRASAVNINTNQCETGVRSVNFFSSFTFPVWLLSFQLWPQIHKYDSA